MPVEQPTLFATDPIGRSAVISECGFYRYRLERRWGDGDLMMWLLLNPSKADHRIDDPTVRRLVGFSRAWGFGGFLLGNAFGLRSTDPKELYRHPDPVGPENDRHLIAMAGETTLKVAAWGSHGTLFGRGDIVRAMVPGMKILGLTKAGEPSHPLYLSADLEPIEWR